MQCRVECLVETADDVVSSLLLGDDEDDPELFSHPSGRDGWAKTSSFEEDVSLGMRFFLKGGKLL